MARFSGESGSGSGNADLVVPTSIKDVNGSNLITFEKTGTGTARISTPQDDLSLRSARDITIYAGDDGPGNVYIGWGDAVYTPDSTNRVATIADIQAANNGNFTFDNDSMTTEQDMTIGVIGVPGEINLSAYAGVNIETFADFGLTANKITLTNNGGIDNIAIGDDVVLGDGNVANHLVVIGQQDPTVGGIVLGQNLTEKVYSSTVDIVVESTNKNILLSPGESNAVFIYNSSYGGNQVMTQDDLNNATASLNDSGWVGVTNLSGDFVAGSVTPGYRKLNGVVYMRGNMHQGNGEEVAFTLPEGFRPDYETVVLAQKFGTSTGTYVTILADGSVKPHESATWLSGISFLAG